MSSAVQQSAQSDRPWWYVRLGEVLVLLAIFGLVGFLSVRDYWHWTAGTSKAIGQFTEQINALAKGQDQIVSDVAWIKNYLVEAKKQGDPKHGDKTQAAIR